jgi:protein-disulfide isomerase
VIFSEFQCPYCSKAKPAMREMIETYGDKLRMVFKHLPLGFHPNAKPAAKAALAAGRQGKFWEYHDELFENQRNLTPETFDKIARDLGLEMDKFNADMKDPALEQQITNDLAQAAKVGARGTPTWFVNGRRVVGARPFSQFKPIIEEELKKAG